MKTKQGTSSQKFVRRTSQSPWQHPHSPTAPEPLNLHTPTPSSLKPQKNHYTPLHPKQREAHTSTRTLTEQSHPTTTGLVRIRRGQLARGEGFRDRDKVQQGELGGQGLWGREKGGFGDCELRIQTASTLESLPTVRKRGQGVEEFGLQTKRKQEYDYEWSKKDIQKILTENQTLLQTESISKTAISSLTLELQSSKTLNLDLQLQLKNQKQRTLALQTKLKNYQIQNQGLRASLQESQGKRVLGQGQVKEMMGAIGRLEAEVRGLRDGNQELKGLLRGKEMERSKMSGIQRCNSVQTGLRITRSTSIADPSSPYPSPYPQNIKIHTVRPQLPSSSHPPQKYNRFIQTQPCKLQITLKQNELLTSCLKTKEKTIKIMQRDIHLLNRKVKGLESTEGRLQEAEKLIQELNRLILVGVGSRLAGKYRYF